MKSTYVIRPIELNIKPISVNECWQGRRFKTPAYKAFATHATLLLPNTKVKYEKIELHLTFGFSNKAADIDNPVKPILDILQKKMNFNDKQIYRLIVNKEIVKSGKEFIRIEFKEFL